MDRPKEHLCTGDISTIKARLKLLDAAKPLREKGTFHRRRSTPVFYRVRGASVVLPDDTSWIVGVKEAIIVPPGVT
jgi:hypothetical protein